MQINPELIDQINKDGLDMTEALLYCFAIEYKLDVARVTDTFVDQDNEMFYRINLTDRDVISNTLSLKIPLFSPSNLGEFGRFITALKARGFTSNGHPNNQVKYSVINTSNEAKTAFLSFYNEDTDFNRLVNCVVSYYERTEMPVKLDKFFNQLVGMEYDSYVNNDKFL